MFEEGQEILDKRYRVMKKLGSGAFGEIYKGKYQAPSSREACATLAQGRLSALDPSGTEERSTAYFLAQFCDSLTTSRSRLLSLCLGVLLIEPVQRSEIRRFV